MEGSIDRGLALKLVVNPGKPVPQLRPVVIERLFPRLGPRRPCAERLLPANAAASLVTASDEIFGAVLRLPDHRASVGHQVAGHIPPDSIPLPGIHRLSPLVVVKLLK